MNLMHKIMFKFHNLFRFEKLNSRDNLVFDVDLKEENSLNNIDLFKNLIIKHNELKDIIWIAIYHCLNTYDASKEYLTVLDVDFEIIADLIDGDDEHVNIPDDVKNEILDGNVLATFHNHFNGAIIPSSRDLENTILPFVKYMVITSHGNIGIIVNDNNDFDDDLFKLFKQEWIFYLTFTNWCFNNDVEEKLNNPSVLNNKIEEQILFEKYISKNLSKFVKEFNLRMEKYNVQFIQIMIKE